MKVFLVAFTSFLAAEAEAFTEDQWSPDYLVGEAGELSEFAGRMCYQSWGRPNAATAKNDAYLDNIRKQQHYSVLEHGTASFALGEVSRSFSHELVRHRHFSFSQLSQRYHKIGEVDAVVPELFRGNALAEDIIFGAWQTAVEAYWALEELAMQQVISDDAVAVHNGHKRAREAARCVLPNMTPTQLVVTGNHRSWLEFIEKRATEHADAEIRAVAVEIFKQLAEHEPNIYAHLEVVDFVLSCNRDGMPREVTRVVRNRAN